jgi:CheY-like chemotaxis protein
MTILLVDDDPMICLLAAFLLRGAGHEVREASDPATAEAAYAAGGIDVILMDVVLGEHDGIALAERLLAGAAAPPPLLFLTGATRADLLERMQRLRPAGVVGKPFDPDTLVPTVERAARSRV